MAWRPVSRGPRTPDAGRRTHCSLLPLPSRTRCCRRVLQNDPAPWHGFPRPRCNAACGAQATTTTTDKMTLAATTRAMSAATQAVTRPFAGDRQTSPVAVWAPTLARAGMIFSAIASCVFVSPQGLALPTHPPTHPSLSHTHTHTHEYSRARVHSMARPGRTDIRTSRRRRRAKQPRVQTASRTREVSPTRIIQEAACIAPVHAPTAITLTNTAGAQPTATWPWSAPKQVCCMLCPLCCASLTFWPLLFGCLWLREREPLAIWLVQPQAETCGRPSRSSCSC